MFRRKQQQKIREEIFKEMESSKTAIGNLVDDYQEFEIYNAESIGKRTDFNYVRVYIYMLCNYGEDICQLANLKRYSSLYILLNNFIECYGLTKNLLTTYFDNHDDYTKLVKTYYRDTLVQRKDECQFFDPETMSVDDAYEEKYYDMRFSQMEKIIGEFFEEHSDEIEGEDRDIAIYEVVNKICEEYPCIDDRTNLAVEALRTNEEFTEEEMKRAIGLYVSAKSAALNNVQTTLTRILGMLDGRVTLLVNKNEGITPQVLSIVEKCLKDITDMAKEGLICDEE